MPPSLARRSCGIISSRSADFNLRRSCRGHRAVDAESSATCQGQEALFVEARRSLTRTDLAGDRRELKVLAGEVEGHRATSPQHGDDLWRRFPAPRANSFFDAASRCSTIATQRRPGTWKRALACRAREFRSPRRRPATVAGAAIGEIKELQRSGRPSVYGPSARLRRRLQGVSGARATRCS